MAWQPQPEPLAQLSQFLKGSLSFHDLNAQRHAEQMLKQAEGSPDFINYLTYICVTPSPPGNQSATSYHAARSAAAILLKNSIKKSYKTVPESSRDYLKSTIIIGLQDTNSQIRSYVGNVITEVVRQGGVMGWPQLLPDLLATAANENGQCSIDAQDGAMGALFKICEDNKRALDQDYPNQGRPLAYLLPKFLELTASPNTKLRARALSAVNVFLSEPIAMTVREHIDQILPRIVRLTSDTNEDVRRFVCRTFALLADGMPAVLVPHLDGIVDYTLAQQKNTQHEELALDAAEFFFEASLHATLRDAMGPFLNKIVPVLLDCMIYSEEDQLRFENEGDDAEEDDREDAIKPVFAKAKNARSGGPSGAETSSSSKPQTATAMNGYEYEDDLSDGEIEDDDDEDFEDDPEDEWNLRKCSAAALDSLASHFGGAVFNVTLPWLMDNLSHKDWQNREAAVLALGAIGPGCMDSISPHLPNLVPYMITLLSDSQPVVRQISCWALSRFAGWAANFENKQQFFEPMMDGILKRMLDGNKKVQESAASAFAALEEAAQAELMPYAGVIVQQFAQCFQHYKDKNVYVLYDCVQILAEYASPELAKPELVNVLMPALIARWERVQDQSREIFPLLECLSFVATALGRQFTPFAKPFWTRCIRIIQTNLEEGARPGLRVPGNVDDDVPDKDFLVTSLDLLSSIVQCLEEQYSAELVATAQPNMFQLLAYCMKDDSNDVRQSAYALLGDCAIYIFSQLQPYLPTLMEIVLQQLDLKEAERDPETGFRVINNTCWSCGEIAMRHMDGMAPYVDRLLTKLAIIMFSREVPESLTENAAIALGRLGIGCHQQLAPHLANFAGPFLHAMQKVGWTDEKGHAYKGFSRIVLDNPQAMEQCLLDFFVEMANAPDVFLTGMQADGPLELFERVLREYKTLIGSGFDEFLHNLPPPQEQAVRQRYVF